MEKDIRMMTYIAEQAASPHFGPTPDFSNVMGTDMPDGGLTPL
jgi:hypothetical protein